MMTFWAKAAMQGILLRLEDQKKGCSEHSGQFGRSKEGCFVKSGQTSGPASASADVGGDDDVAGNDDDGNDNCDDDGDV